MTAAKRSKRRISNYATPQLIPSIIVALDQAARQAAQDRETIAADLREHTALDARRFEELNNGIAAIATDVKSLLASRSFTRGVVKAILLYSTAVSTVVGLLIAYASR